MPICCKPSYTESVLLEARTVVESLEGSRKDKGHKIVLLSRADEAEAVRVMSSSFNGTASTDAEPGFDWVLGPAFHGKHDDPVRVEFFNYYMRWVFLACVKYGIVVGVRDANDGTLLAVTGALPPGRSHVSESSSFLKPHMLSLALVVRAGPPDVMKPRAFAPLTTERMEAMNTAMTTGRAAHLDAIGGKDGHWYVYVVATAPKAQGRGCTRSALDVLNAVADRSGHTSCLDANSEKNCRIYERLGYRVLGTHPMATSPILFARDTAPPNMHFMARPATPLPDARQ